MPSFNEAHFNRSSYLAIASNDRAVRVFNVKSNAGHVTLELLHKLQDNVARTPWNGITWSKNGDYVVGGTPVQIALSAHMYNVQYRGRQQSVSHHLHLGQRYRPSR